METVHLEKRFEEALEFLLNQEYKRALSLLEKLIKARPKSAWIWLHYGNAALGVDDFHLAERALSRAQELEPCNAQLALSIGQIYVSYGQSEKAHACFSSAALLEPRNINPRISLAVLLERNHLFDEARQCILDCLKIDPRDEQALYFAAVLDHREKKYEVAERSLRDLIAGGPKHPYVIYACRYELAQILEHSGRHEEAMVLLTEAKKMVKKLTELDAVNREYDFYARVNIERAKNLPKNILSTWATMFPGRRRESIPPLAFLGGHPRSGTTLLAQVLDAHPSVIAFDEKMAFLKYIGPDSRKMEVLSCPRLNVLRRNYIRALTERFPGNMDNKTLIDKNPSPTAFLPMWLRVLPDSRVVIALRDPRDVVISCYFQNIPLNNVNSNFLSFERLAKHYTDLMSVWLAVRQWEGFDWIETRYEDVVNDLESEGRRVTSFLGLDWHEAQMRFYEKRGKNKVISPTYHDVTQPLYKRAVARWLPYEKYLEPILPILEPYCRAFGYK